MRNYSDHNSQKRNTTGAERTDHLNRTPGEDGRALLGRSFWQSNAQSSARHRHGPPRPDARQLPRRRRSPRTEPKSLPTPPSPVLRPHFLRRPPPAAEIPNSLEQARTRRPNPLRTLFECSCGGVGVICSQSVVFGGRTLGLPSHGLLANGISGFQVPGEERGTERVQRLGFRFGN